MKNIFLTLLFLFLFAVSAFAQSPNTIRQRCPSPNGSVYGVIQITAAGNIVYTPCPTKSSIFTGNVNFSGATIISGAGSFTSLTVNPGPFVFTNHISFDDPKNNTTMGAGAGAANTTGSLNTVFGSNSLATNSTGFGNSSFGFNSLASTTGSANTAVGGSALGGLTSGSNNTAIGYNTGGGITTGIGNTVIGANVTGLAAGLTQTVIVASGDGTQRLLVNSSGGQINGAAVPTGASATINTLPKFTSATAIGNSRITDSGVSINIGGTHAIGDINIDSGTGDTDIGDIGATGNHAVILLSDSNKSVLINAGSGGTASIGTVGATGVSIDDGGAAKSTSVVGLIPTNHVINLTTNYTNATAGFTNTALSRTLVAGKTYSFTVQLFCSNSTAAEGIQVDFNGGNATATTFVAGSNTTLINSVTSTLAGTFSNATLTGTNLVTIKGTIIVNAGGTFIVRAAEVSHATGTLTIQTGSSLVLTRMN